MSKPNPLTVTCEQCEGGVRAYVTDPRSGDRVEYGSRAYYNTLAYVRLQVSDWAIAHDREEPPAVVWAKEPFYDEMMQTKGVVSYTLLRPV
jgi:hypothetical protein